MKSNYSVHNMQGKSICLICNSIVDSHRWICQQCYEYITKDIINKVLDEVGVGYDRIPNHIPKQQYDKYLVSKLLKYRKEI